ncbi:translin-associated factor X-interacting protein 1 isoform X2 [Halichoeres trimaculatus]
MDVCYIYATPDRKPHLLEHLESFVNKELQTLSSSEPNYQELKLQIYRNAFGRFIRAFTAYQPLLSAIKKEYENTIAYQHHRIRELEPLQSRLRMVTEECDRKIQARWEEEQTEMRALKSEKQQLQKDLEAMMESKKTMQKVVDHLQAEVTNQYLQYREEHDARKLLIWQLNDLTICSVKEENSADKNTRGVTETDDPVELRLALKMCRGDLTKVQKELFKLKAEYWDVVPRGSWDTLKQTHTETLQQLKTLQGDFDQLKTEYDTLLELHTGSHFQTERQGSISDQGTPEEEKPPEVREGATDVDLNVEQTELQQ